MKKGRPVDGPSAETAAFAAANRRALDQAPISTEEILVTAAMDRSLRLDTGSPPFSCCANACNLRA